MRDKLNIDAAAKVIFQGKWTDALKLSELDFSQPQKHQSDTDYFKRIQESAIYDISHMRYVAKQAVEAALLLAGGESECDCHLHRNQCCGICMKKFI